MYCFFHLKTLSHLENTMMSLYLLELRTLSLQRASIVHKSIATLFCWLQNNEDSIHLQKRRLFSPWGVQNLGTKDSESRESSSTNMINQKIANCTCGGAQGARYFSWTFNPENNQGKSLFCCCSLISYAFRKVTMDIPSNYLLSFLYFCLFVHGLWSHEMNWICIHIWWNLILGSGT